MGIIGDESCCLWLCEDLGVCDVPLRRFVEQLTGCSEKVRVWWSRCGGEGRFGRQVRKLTRGKWNEVSRESANSLQELRYFHTSGKNRGFSTCSE